MNQPILAFEYRRSRAREVALQLLFQHDTNADVPRSVIQQFAQRRLKMPPLVDYCLTLYDGVLLHLSSLDAAIQAASENWKIHRMPIVDRNVLRIGAFEMLSQTPPIPMAVAINEAVELARRYGSADSPSFVNGVLDRIGKSQIPKDHNAPSEASHAGA